jgi:heat shock protein HslJ
MRTHRVIGAFWLAIAACFLSGCAGERPRDAAASAAPSRPAASHPTGPVATPTPAAPTDREESSVEAIDEKLVGTWELQRLDGLGEEGALPDGMRRVPTLIVQPDGRIGGFGGTNQYFGRLDTDAAARGEFRAREVGSTLMAGPHDDVERAFHRHLQASNRVSIDGDELTLRHADGSEARFRRAGAPADPDADANAGASPEAAPDAQPPAHDEPIHVDALVGSWRLADFLGDGPALPGGEPTVASRGLRGSTGTSAA